jgi:hypothetical protein
MAVDPFAGVNQGLRDMQGTLASLYNMRRQEKQDAQSNMMHDLQVQQSRQGIEQNKLTLAGLNAQQGALTDMYGTTGQPDALQRATSFQMQETKDTEKQKQATEKQKYAFDAFSKVADAVKNGLVDEGEAGAFYRNQMKMAGLDLATAGVDISFKKQGGFFSGPVQADSLFMVNGKPTPYGAAGVVGKARIVGADPQTGKPIFEMDAATTFKEPAAAKPDQEALIDKRFANQQKLQNQQIAAADRRTDKQIAAAAEHGMKTANGHGKILPAGQLESIADMKRVKDVLAEASDLLKSGKIDTGPVSGRLQSLGSKVGLASDSFVNLQQKMQTAENIMLKLRSGAAVTESEYQRFKKEFPRTSDTPEVRDRKMSNAIAYASTLMDSKMDIYEGGGYRVPKSVKSGTQAQAKGKPSGPRKIGKYTVEVH